MDRKKDIATPVILGVMAAAIITDTFIINRAGASAVFLALVLLVYSATKLKERR